MVFLVLVLCACVAGEDSPPGLVSQDSEHDLQAEASQSGSAAQKREASLSNSYGEPLPPDAYGPPADLPNLDLQHPVPAPVYGVPDQLIFPDPPPGAYGPPAPVDFPSQAYHGPPPPPRYRPKPVYGPPKHTYGPPKPVYGPPKYGPPKQSYGPPKQSYGPPKKTYGPPKQNLPKPTYGVPFKPPKISYNKPLFSHSKPVYGPPKPVYGPPKPVYGPPKPVYGPPKPIYGPPKIEYGPPKIEQGPPAPVYGPPKIEYGPPKLEYGPPQINFGPPQINYGPPIRDAPSFPLPELPQLSLPPLDNNNNNFDFGLNLPAPIYGTPFMSLPSDLKPNFPIPTDSYGPPGIPLGPIGPNDQIVVHNLDNIGHYGPPQPDPNPQPPHPGIPAPPTPPHVLYDGWKPIPGVSKPVGQITDQYGPPTQDIHINLDQSLPNIDQHHQFTSGSDQFLGNTQFSDNYNQFSSGNHQFSDNNHELLSGSHQLSSGNNQFSSGNHQHSSGNHQFSDNNNQFSSGNHQLSSDNHQHLSGNHHSSDNHQFSSGAQISSGYSTVHQDALANIDLNAIVGGDSNHIDPSKTVFEAHYTENNNNHAQSVVSDSYGAPPLDSLSGGPYPASLRQQGAKGLVPAGLPLAYGQHSGGGHSGGSTPRRPVQFRAGVPAGLFSNIAHTTRHKDALSIDHAPHSPAYIPPPISNGNSVSLSIEPTSIYSLPHSGNPISFQQPSNLYGSPIDSYSAPLLTVGVGDHVTSDSNTNTITSTIDGMLLANLSNLDAAAILKHCPYHEAILKAAQAGERIPVDLATKYVNSLSSLGTTLNKDLLSHSDISISNSKRENKESYQTQKSKSLKEKHTIKDERLQYVSDQIQKTSDRIRSLSEEAKQLQQKIVSSNQNIISNPDSTASQQLGSYSVQIQSSNGGKSTVPHDQLLSEGLLQSILQAIDDPSKPGQQQQQISQQHQLIAQQQQQISQQVQQQNELQQQNQQQKQQQQLQQQHFSQQQQQIQQQQITQQQEQQQQLSQQQFAQQQQQQFAQQEHSFSQQSHQQQNQQQLSQQQISQQQLSQQQISQQQLPNNYLNNFNSNNLESLDGLVLPAGYEPVDHSKNDQESQGSQHKHTQVVHNCDLKTEASSKNEVVVPAPENMKSIDKDDNEVAVYFDDKSETVTEISVATSISEKEA